ncbi:hypothetical protein [Simiduia litorea]|uniref:hypothetical protein n=1 Tax=Simiduia litorea TaxID=1435348 RepID=UPI0036F1D64D
MKQFTVKVLLYTGLGMALLAAVLMAVLTLLCRLTPTVTVENNSQETLSNIVIALPSNTLRFDNIAPGESAQIFYDAAQNDGQYHVTLTRGTVAMQTHCGSISQGEWGKRMVISVHGDAVITCKEQLRF